MVKRSDLISCFKARRLSGPLAGILTALTPLLLAVLIAGWVAPKGLAHHGWSGYHTTLQTMSGQVTSYGYNYPHASLHVQVGGKTIEIVLAPPSRMARRGLAADSIKPGDKISVQGYVHRERDTEVRAERIEMNGQTFELR